MTGYRGFATEAEAKEYIRENGGLLTYDKRNRKGEPTGVGVDYMYAVYDGLDTKRFPFCVQWSIS